MINKNTQKAFSFIEILVVVTIIGILATFAVVTYSEFVKQSRDAKRKGDLEQIRAAVEMYKSKNNIYPLTAAVVIGSSLCDPGPDCASGTYLQKIPADPKPTTYTYYYFSATGSDYVIGAYLEQPSTSSCGNCSLGLPAACNYCMGPYGQL